MPNEFESYFKSFAELEGEKDPVINLSHEYPQRLSEWRTRAQLVLEHHYIELQNLLHEYSLFGCAHNEHAKHPLCKLENRLQNLLKTVSPKGANYRVPRLHRYEMGDEKSPNTPLMEEQQKMYDVIVSAISDFEKELAQLRTAGVKIQDYASLDSVPTISSVPVNPIHRADGSVAVQESQGIDTQTTERKSVETEHLGFNPLEQPAEFIQFAMQLYIKQNLPEWTAGFQNLEARIRSLPREKRAIIERELREGSIAILMPGREVQRQTLDKALQVLKPSWFDTGVEKPINAPYGKDWIKKIVQDKNEALFRDVPSIPYILLAKPTPTPPESTTRKSPSQQNQEFLRMQNERPELRRTNIPGYLALQVWATRTKDREGMRHIEPLDRDSSTRFTELPIVDREVLNARFNDSTGLLSLGSDDNPNGSYMNVGIRFEIRVEI